MTDGSAGRPSAVSPRLLLATLAVFALLGPPIGSVVVFGTIMILTREVLASGERVLADFVAIPIALGFLGYIAGLLPALATGLAVAWLRPRVASRSRLVGLGAVIGALASATTLVWLATAAEPGLFGLLAGLIAVAGAVAGAICTAVGA